MNTNITLVGRVVANPVQKTIGEKETRIVEFSVACKDYGKKDPKAGAMFFDVKAFNGVGELVMQYVREKREIVVNGRVTVDKYTRKNGTEVVKFSVICNGFHLCSTGKPAEAESTGDSDEPTEAESTGDHSEQSAA